MAFSQCCARTSAAQVQLPESADDLALSLTSRLASVYAQAKISTLMLKTCEKVGETYQCSISLLPKYLKHSCVGNKRIQIRRVKDFFYLGRHAYNRRRYCQRQRPSKDRLSFRTSNYDYLSCSVQSNALVDTLSFSRPLVSSSAIVTKSNLIRITGAQFSCQVCQYSNWISD